MSGSSDTLKFHLPTHDNDILSKMNALRVACRFCDVTLLLGGPLGTTVQPFRFHGHRVVLAASSDFLHDQFLLHEGQAELSVGVVSSVQVGRRLLLSCYTGLLEVPLKELVSYLTAASALQMSQVVEKCAQAVSQYLSPTLALSKLERRSEEREIQQPDGGWPYPSSQNQEERDAAQPSTSLQEASTEEGEKIMIQPKSKSRVSHGIKVDSQGLSQVRQDRGRVKVKIASSKDAACCFNTLESEEVGGIQPVHTNKPIYQVHHITDARRCKLHTTPHVSFTTVECSVQQGEVVDNFQNLTETLSVAAQPQECGELMDSNMFCLSGANLSKSYCSRDELTKDLDSVLVQRPYLCKRCDRVFQHLESYVGHLKEHRRYLCLVCGQGFSQMGDLSRHIRIHTGAKPFRCPLCHETFPQKAKLQDHLNLHTGNKPHECNYCAGCFAHKPDLRRHLKDIHGKKTIEKFEEVVG